VSSGTQNLNSIDQWYLLGV